MEGFKSGREQTRRERREAVNSLGDTGFREKQKIPMSREYCAKHIDTELQPYEGFWSEDYVWATSE